MTPIKFRLIQDNDGHWFVIDEEDESAFYDWVKAQENCTTPEQDFSQAMISSPFHIRFPHWEHC